MMFDDPSPATAALDTVPRPQLRVPSQRHPTLADALRIAQPGTDIYIAPGAYDENIVLNKPINLIADIGEETDGVERPGVSIASITVTANATDVLPDLNRVEPGVTPEIFMTVDVRHIRLLGMPGRPTIELLHSRLHLVGCAIGCQPSASDEGTCIRLHRGCSVVLDGCELRGGAYGIVALGGQLTLARCDFSGFTRAAVDAREQACALLEHCALRGGPGAGARASQGAELHASESSFDGHAMAAVEVSHAHRSSVLGCTFAKSRGAGIVLVECGTHVRVSGNSLHSIETSAIEVHAGLSTPVPRGAARPDGGGDAALLHAAEARVASAAGTVAAADNANASGAEHWPEHWPTSGPIIDGNTLRSCRVGVLCSGGGQLQPRVQRNSFAHCSLSALELANDSRCVASHNTVLHSHMVGILVTTRAQPLLLHNGVRASGQAGLEVSGGARAHAVSLHLSANTGHGALVRGAGSRLHLRHSRVLANRCPGVAICDGASATLTENEVLGGRSSGIDVGIRCSAVVLRNAVRGNGLSASAEFKGRHKVFGDAPAAGIVIRTGATPVLEGNVISANAGAGVFADYGAAGRVFANSFCRNELEAVRVRPESHTVVEGNVELELADDAGQVGVPVGAVRRRTHGRPTEAASAVREPGKEVIAAGAELDSAAAGAGVAEAVHAALHSAASARKSDRVESVDAAVERGSAVPFGETYGRKPQPSEQTLHSRAADVRAKYESLKADKGVTWLLEMAPSQATGGGQTGSEACAVQ